MSSTKVYSGSCHCGDITYQIRLTLPPNDTIGFDGTRIYKCNCSTCHKMGMFHCRPSDLVNDFIVTSPSDISEVGEYRCFTKKIGWYFCKRCGVRTFGVGGGWVPTEIDVAKWAGEESGEGKLQKVFMTEPLKSGHTGYDGKPLHYVSVNGLTLDGLDLIEAHDKGWVYYVENKFKKDGDYPQMRFKEPFEGGCY
ncbi:hypothetical protein BU23DRAFT_558831 [Bimuria novae-zelandiae CBS 107.79]|uniref:CENP-V/GFA domain-containing protein n=1 Tax=Bimuria novae-zelandiae CBS 107.79 TaxID=1447943 RepID=A0A6A5UZ65_9PLEO|nr:hypothetical protein BU23DRAFT_558831 [Bimuria novae-zelandiae CBS 107.79]